MNFDCAFDIDLSTAVFLGDSSSQSSTAFIGGTDVSIGAFEDSSFTKVLKKSQKLAPGQEVFLGWVIPTGSQVVKEKFNMKYLFTGPNMFSVEIVDCSI